MLLSAPLLILVIFLITISCTPHTDLFAQQKSPRALQKTSAHQKVPSKKKPALVAQVKGKSARSSKTPYRKTKREHVRQRQKIIQTEDIKLKQHELDRLRDEIATYQQRLSSTERKEKNTLNRLDDYDKQTKLIRKLVSQLNLQVRDNQREIEIARLNLRALENQLQRLLRSYSEYVTNMYIRGPLHDTEILLSSASLNQMFIRAKYLRAFTDRQKSAVDEIRATQQKIRAQQGILESKLNTQRTVITEKKQEESILNQKTDEHTRLLAQVRKEKENYQRQLERKQSAMREIEQIVSRLIEHERQKREETLRRRNEEKNKLADRDTKTRRHHDLKITELPTKQYSETAFGKLHGRLPWPVVAGRVITNFGNQVHPTLRTVTINKGIDIGMGTASAVKSVADGTVSIVSFIPGFGHLVIINHDDGFFTVYAHLSQVLVRSGQQINAGHPVGTSGESESGSQVHFEIWRERSVQNPLNWLAKR